MDEDDPWLRQPWEDADPPPRQTLAAPRPATRRSSFRWPGRRTPSGGGADGVADDHCARLALFEAAGFLAHCGPAVHPHDLALREAPGSPRRSPMPGNGAGSANSRPCGRSNPSTAWRRRWRNSARSSRSTKRRAPGSPRCLGLPIAWPAGDRPGHGVRAAGHAREHRLRARPDLRGGRALAPSRLRMGLRAAVLGGAGIADRGAGAPRGGEIELGYLDGVAEAAMRGRASSIGCSPPRAGSPNCLTTPAHGCLRPRRRLAGAAGHRTPARPSARCFNARRSGGRSPSLEEGSLTGKGRSRARSTSAAGKIGFRWPVGHPDAKSSRKIVAPWQLEPDCCIASL